MCLEKICIFIEAYISSEGFYCIFEKMHRQQATQRSFILSFSLCAEGFSLTFKINYMFAIITDGNQIRPKLSSLLMVFCSSYGKKKHHKTKSKPKNLSSQNQSVLGFVMISWSMFPPQTQSFLAAVERKMTLPEPPAEPVTVLSLPLDLDFKDISSVGRLSCYSKVHTMQTSAVFQ